MLLPDESVPFQFKTKDSGLSFSFSKDHDLPTKPLNTSDHILSRGIKLKKRHEINQLCKIIPAVFELLNDCNDIIDCGAGQGHLSRILTLCHGFRVHCIEGNSEHVTGAIDRDTKVLNALRKAKVEVDKFFGDMPSKVNCFVTKDDQIEQLVDKPVGQHLLLGLHACGVLSNMILEQFATNHNSVALVLACCCYMKSDLSRYSHFFRFPFFTVYFFYRFPMSQFLKENIRFELSIEAKELACHAIEKFLFKFNKNGKNFLLPDLDQKICLSCRIGLAQSSRISVLFGASH